MRSSKVVRAVAGGCISVNCLQGATPTSTILLFVSVAATTTTTVYVYLWYRYRYTLDGIGKGVVEYRDRITHSYFENNSCESNKNQAESPTSMMDGEKQYHTKCSD